VWCACTRSLAHGKQRQQCSIARAGLSYNTIFEEIPIKISNISLVKAFLAELEDNDFLDRGAEFDRLSDVSSDAFLEKGTHHIL
jgi:hypothetical protein